MTCGMLPAHLLEQQPLIRRAVHTAGHEAQPRHLLHPRTETVGTHVVRAHKTKALMPPHAGPGIDKRRLGEEVHLMPVFKQ